MALVVKAKYDYDSGHEDDLRFTAGQLITVLEEVDEEWYNGEFTGSDGVRHQGMFPRNFVTIANVPAPPEHRPVRRHETGEKESTPKSIGSSETSAPPPQPTKSHVDPTVKAPASPPSPSTKIKQEPKPQVKEAQSVHSKSFYKISANTCAGCHECDYAST